MVPSRSGLEAKARRVRRVHARLLLTGNAGAICGVKTLGSYHRAKVTCEKCLVELDWLMEADAAYVGDFGFMVRRVAGWSAMQLLQFETNAHVMRSEMRVKRVR